MKKPLSEWYRVKLDESRTGSWRALNKAQIPKPSYVVVFGAILFEKEEYAREFEKAYNHRS